jgi:hypothetical protein
MKKPTNKEKVQTYEALFNKINFHRSFTHQEQPIFKILGDIDNWVNAHRNEGSPEEIDQRVIEAYEKLKTNL